MMKKTSLITFIFVRLYPVDRSRLDEDIGELVPASEDVKTKKD